MREDPNLVLRVRACNEAPVSRTGNYVVYWMTAQRRPTDNFALDRALDWCDALGLPLIVFEALRVGHRWASARFHRFVMDGMAIHDEVFASAGVCWYGYVEPTEGAGRGLLAALAERAAVIVTDEYPAFFFPNMLLGAARLPVRVEAVDGCGLLPMRANPRAWPSAATFRRHLQKTLPDYLSRAPRVAPLSMGRGVGAEVPGSILRRWPAVSQEALRGDGRSLLAALPIDHGVGPVALRGGPREGEGVVGRFVARRLGRYADARNQVVDGAASGLSPYLHFGHVGVHQVFRELLAAEGWAQPGVAPKATGSREGWWGMSPGAEAFLDELVTWRELGFAEAFHNPSTYDTYEGLPGWARASLEAHAADPRNSEYRLDELEEARTHDPVWNAAQRELVETGVMHNYLRMLWGKKILEWSPSPQAAFARMVHLNNRWALDGRDPNSYTGISWVMGRYDRPWAPERPVYGVIRYMSSDATRRKLELGPYLARFGGGQARLFG